MSQQKDIFGNFVEATEVDPDQKVKSFKPKHFRAIDWYAKNYKLKVVLSSYPQVILRNDSGDQVAVDISTVYGEYQLDRKEQAKEKARAKRLNLN